MTIAAECLEMDGAALLEALDHMIALMLEAGCNIALIALIVRAILAPSGQRRYPSHAKGSEPYWVTWKAASSIYEYEVIGVKRPMHLSSN